MSAPTLEALVSYRPGEGFEVWLCSAITGDRKELLGTRGRRRDAEGVARRWNRR